MSPSSPAAPLTPIELAAMSDAALAAEIERHNRLYFAEASPEISDAEFDRLVATLKRRAPEHPVLHKVGAAVEDATTDKVEHRVPMLSLDKVYDEAQLRFWAKAAPEAALVATPKIDGLACSISYGADRQVRLAATRGDGSRGENVTANVRQIPDIPNELPADVAWAGDGIEVRGEVYLPLSVFRTVSDQFANPRNLAAGTLKAKELTVVPLSGLRFLAYDLLGASVRTKREKLARLRELGFSAAPERPTVPDQIGMIYAEFLSARDQLDYETDGVVVEFDDLALQQRLGTTAHHPRGAVAWKYPSDLGTSVLRAIEWSVSRTGTITPVAITDPVSLSGASVTRATLHNLSNLRRLGLRLGDTVLLARRGGVIPHLEATHGGGDVAVTAPEHCPSCGSPTRVTVTVSTGRVAAEPVETLACTTPETCVVARLRSLVHYCASLDLKGFGEKIVELLLDQRLVNDPADLYTLQAGDLAALPRMGPTSADNLLKQLDKARSVDLTSFLVALGVDSLGRQTADLLARRWSLDEILALDVAELRKVHTLGGSSKKAVDDAGEDDEARKARAIVQGLSDKRPLLDKLLQQVRVSRPQTGAGPMAGQVVVFTGGLESMGRRDAQQLVAQQGGMVGTSVTAETTLVVVGREEREAATHSSKYTKALKLKENGQAIELVDEAGFRLRVGMEGA